MLSGVQGKQSQKLAWHMCVRARTNTNMGTRGNYGDSACHGRRVFRYTCTSLKASKTHELSSSTWHISEFTQKSREALGDLDTRQKKTQWQIMFVCVGGAFIFYYDLAIAWRECVCVLLPIHLTAICVVVYANFTFECRALKIFS